ncbi:MAG TPA: hypothetical protein VGU24_06700 [Microvirga sp.]|nr:hypothetical protein [Microvirga sp.]
MAQTPGSIIDVAFDANFTPNPRQINAIRGLFIAAFDDDSYFNGSLGGIFPEIDFMWIKANIPNGNARMNELIEAGFVWQWRAFEGDYALGLTTGALEWAQSHLGMPAIPDDKSLQDVPEIEAWAKTLDFKPKASVEREGATRAGKKVGVASVGVWVQHERYSPAMAKEARERIDAEVEAGRMSVASARAYSAHISRRSV